MTTPRDPDADDLWLVLVGFVAAVVTGILGGWALKRRLG